ncbi:hypothetical protein [Saccharicrinis aurantiacus]|uniref:hypothetical protein n=1 Tax=Saccharicrinis aurantiacus TaxID=1849719 RepID=UPI002492FB05|nr:hypothetical protein [Saccharicrinis aurantiacus]
MKRRDFFKISALAGIGLSLPMGALMSSCEGENEHSNEFKQLVFDLLKDWCDGMLKQQIIIPPEPESHGLLVCPTCDVVHARCMDAVYPFLYMAKQTGEDKYLEAGIAVLEWANYNVTLPDGSWSNALDPKSWNGTTVFGAISLAEALYYHSDLLDEARVQAWKKRLDEAAQFIHKKFTLTFTNINYGATAIYALNLIGRVLDKPIYINRSKELASGVKEFFTHPNGLLYGEGKPSDKISAKGLPVVDLGYNVEESLNSIVMYALHEGDEELLQIVSKSLESHLEFMMPDGGWDNSWGTRQYKWTYWGSRTCDGSSISYAMMAHKNPAFATAAIKNTELLKRCTADGLLQGGLHYSSHGIKTCIHHTFAHAKPLTTLLDHWAHLSKLNDRAPLPRAVADGIKHYDELDTTLLARGDWRGTITAYDAIYKDGDYKHPTGGVISALYHNKVGLLLAGSMAIYKLVEVRNQQPAPGEDIALTPRIETFKDDHWYSNIFDLTAKITSSDNNGVITSVAKAKLRDKNNQEVSGTASNFEIDYKWATDFVQIFAKTSESIKNATQFVLPIISASSELVQQLTSNEIRIKKETGTVVITSNVSLKIKDMPKTRTFNMVPGVEALPILATIENKQNINIKIQVI